MMHGATGGTTAERELVGVSDLVESVTVFPYHRPSVTPPATMQSFTITRSGNVFLVQTNFVPTFSSARTNTTNRVDASDRVMLRNPRRD